jgi:L-fuconolactonase
MTERIDAHHHLWRYQKEEYGWIGPGMEVLMRDFLPSEIQEEMRACGIGGSVAVQARQSLAETEWLLGLAEQSEFIRGVVGWAPIAGPDFPRLLEQWSGRTRLKGLRHVIQDEADDQFILSKQFNQGISALAPTKLVYDILIFDRHLPAAISFVDRHPNQIFVLDHLAKPRIKERVLEPWRRHLFELARRGNACCKLSAMVTEANTLSWTTADLRPYFDAVLEAFGPARLMVGSDWPVCLLATSYRRWMGCVAELVGGLSKSEQAAIWGGVAVEVYSLDQSARAAKR